MTRSGFSLCAMNTPCAPSKSRNHLTAARLEPDHHSPDNIPLIIHNQDLLFSDHLFLYSRSLIRIVSRPEGDSASSQVTNFSFLCMKGATSLAERGDPS